MATTRIIPMHLNKGKSIKQCLSERIDYGKNSDKTENGTFISSYACEPETADADFTLSKREYFQLTGRKQDSDVIAYQVRQSFKPGEITPEEANRIGYEFAERFLKGNHAFIVCTHTDKHHIHNHIYWNSTTLDCTHKFRNFWGSTLAVRRLSDLICVQHRMSVIENPRPHGMSYNRWQGDIEKLSKRLWQYIVTRTAKERSYYRYENGKREKHTIHPKLGEKAAHNGHVIYTLDFDVTPHMLRHTYITNLIYSGADPKTVQYLAGHESSKITMDIYAKVKYNRPEELAVSMAEAFALWDD